MHFNCKLAGQKKDGFDDQELICRDALSEFIKLTKDGKLLFQQERYTYLDENGIKTTDYMHYWKPRDDFLSALEDRMKSRIADDTLPKSLSVIEQFHFLVSLWNSVPVPPSNSIVISPPSPAN